MEKRKRLLISVVFVLALIAGFVVPPVGIAMVYLLCLHFALAGNNKTLLFFLFFCAVQNLWMLVMANQFRGIYTTLVLLSKEIMLYLSVVILFLKKLKMKKWAAEPLFLAMVLLVMIAFFTTEEPIYARIVSVRQLMLPFVCIYFGKLVRLTNKGFRTVMSSFLSLAAVVALLGLVEILCYKDTLWQKLPFMQYSINKGTEAFGSYNGVMLNFYTWDFQSIVQEPLRRLVSLYVDPLITGHILFLAFVMVSIKKKSPAVWFLMALYGLAAILTLSKGIYLSFAVYGALYLFFRYLYPKIREKKKWHLFWLIVVGMGVSVIAAAMVLYTAFPDSATAIHMEGLLNGFSNAGLFGHGMGKAGVMTSISGAEESLSRESFFGVVATQTGLVGITVFLAFFIQVAVKLIRKMLQDKNPQDFAALALLCALLVEMPFSESSVSIVGTGLHFIFIGIRLSKVEGSFWDLPGIDELWDKFQLKGKKSMNSTDAKIIAFHLPQFHAIPENDEWWGKGFTEWVNVKKAQPLYLGHNQPRVPQNNDYYNMLDEAVFCRQFAQAREYGVHGFCYYHYWFNGKLLLEKPLEKMLKMEDKLPYFFCWANEPWARTWDGKANEVLMPQYYGGEKEWEEHFQYLLPFFADPFYMKKDGKPILVLYRTNDIPDCEAMITYLNKRCKENGFEGLYLIEEKNSFQQEQHCSNANAILNFEPMCTLSNYRTFCGKVIDKVRKHLFNRKMDNQMLVYSYDAVWKRILARKTVSTSGRKEYRGAFVDWDNTPRKGKKGLVCLGANPHKFAGYMKKLVQLVRKEGSEFIFINAWNEWGEGTYLEPDETNGFAFLEAIRDALR